MKLDRYLLKTIKRIKKNRGVKYYAELNIFSQAKRRGTCFKSKCFIELFNDPHFFFSGKYDTKGNNYIDHISKSNFPCVTFDVTISVQSEKRGKNKRLRKMEDLVSMINDQGETN